MLHDGLYEQVINKRLDKGTGRPSGDLRSTFPMIHAASERLRP